MDKIQLNHNQLANLIASSVGEEITTIVVGENGIGKTAIYKTLQQVPALANHIFPRPIACTQLDVGDHMIPVPDFERGVSRNLPNERYGISQDNHRDIKNGRPVVLCLDELGKAPRHVQASLAPLFYDRELGSLRLPQDSLVFATSNLGEEGLGDLLQAHTRNRIEVVHARKPSAEEWMLWGQNQNPAINEYVLAFAKMYPQAFQSFTEVKLTGNKNLSEVNPYIFNPSAQQPAYFSPRSAERASKRLSSGLGRLDDDSLLASLVGSIGDPAARDLWGIVSLRSEIVHFEEVIAEPKKARMCSNPIAQIVQVFQFVNRTEHVDHAKAVLIYVKRMREEAQALFCRAVSDNLTRAVHYTKCAEWGELMTKHKLSFGGGV